MEQLKQPAQFKQSEHVIIARVENSSGVVSRISGFFTRRGYNLESFTTSTTEAPEIYHLTFKVRCSQDETKLLVHQLGKIKEVIEVYETGNINTITREIMLMKIKCPQEKNLEIMQICQMSDIKILGRGDDGTATIEVAGSGSKLDDIQKLLAGYQIIEIVRSAPICVAEMTERQN